MRSPSLTRLSCTSRHFRAMLKSEVFRKIHLSFDSIQQLFLDSKRWKDQKLPQILPFVRELAIRPGELHRPGLWPKEFPSDWSAALPRVLRSAPLLERLHMYEVSFDADVLEAIQQCNLVHLLTYRCTMYDDSDTPRFLTLRNPRMRTLCHLNPSQRNPGPPFGPAIWHASFFVPSLTHLILDSTPGKSSYTLCTLSVLPHLRYLSVSCEPRSPSDVSDQVGAVLGGSKDLEALHVNSGTRAGLQIACPPLPHLRRISCQLLDLHKLLPGNHIEELELDGHGDNSEASPDQLIETIRAGKGIIKKLVFLPTSAYRIPCTVVSGLVKALPCLQELRLVIEPSVCAPMWLSPCCLAVEDADIRLPSGHRGSASRAIYVEIPSGTISPRPTYESTSRPGVGGSISRPAEFLWTTSQGNSVVSERAVGERD